MSTIDTTTSTITLRTDLGTDITTEHLRSTIDAALTLVQYAADSLTTNRYHHIEFDAATLHGARDRASSRSLARGLVRASERAYVVDRTLDLAGDDARVFSLNLTYTLELARARAGARARGSSDERASLAGDLLPVAGTLNRLAQVLNNSEINNRGLEELFNGLVDQLVDSGLFTSAPSAFTGVLALSYRNPLEIVIDVLKIVGGGLGVGAVLGGLRILFGSGPAERAEARVKDAEARVKNTEADRNELENERLRRDFVEATGRPAAPFDERVEKAIHTVSQNSWIVELD